MVAARTGWDMFDYAARPGLRVAWVEAVMAIDWNRVLLQAIGEHERVHQEEVQMGEPLCGTCIRSVLLRIDE